MFKNYWTAGFFFWKQNHRIYKRSRYFVFTGRSILHVGHPLEFHVVECKGLYVKDLFRFFMTWHMLFGMPLPMVTRVIFLWSHCGKTRQSFMTLLVCVQSLVRRLLNPTWRIGQSLQRSRRIRATRGQEWAKRRMSTNYAQEVAVVEKREKVSGIALEYLYVYHESYCHVCLDCFIQSKLPVQVLNVTNSV